MLTLCDVENTAVKRYAHARDLRKTREKLSQTVYKSQRNAD